MLYLHNDLSAALSLVSARLAAEAVVLYSVADIPSAIKICGIEFNPRTASHRLYRGVSSRQKVIHVTFRDNGTIEAELGGGFPLATLERALSFPLSLLEFTRALTTLSDLIEQRQSFYGRFL